MQFEFDSKVQELQRQLLRFMDEHVFPNEQRFQEEIQRNRWSPVPVIEELKPKARAAGLWNLFLPESEYGAGLTNFEDAPLCEIMGRSSIASEIFNCSAPDTGNMEVLVRYGTAEQKDQWLKPLLAGEIRSCFAMSEPAVASSDATNIEASIVRESDEYLINGRKWWTSGAGDPRCKIAIFMGKTNSSAPPHQQQSMVVNMQLTQKSAYTRFQCNREPRIRYYCPMAAQVRARKKDENIVEFERIGDGAFGPTDLNRDLLHGQLQTAHFTECEIKAFEERLDEKCLAEADVPEGEFKFSS